MIKLLGVLFFTLSITVVFGQDPIKEGDAFFNEGNFLTALEYYQKAIKKDTTNTELRHNIAICYLNLNMDRSTAIPHLQYVVKQEKFDHYAYYDLARAYHYNHQFDEAIKNYKKYINLDAGSLFGGKDEEFVKLAKLGKKQCKNARKLVSKPIDVNFYILGEDINTEHNEYQPYIPADESTLVFTSDERYDSRYKVHVNNVYVAEKDGAEWERPKRVGVVNSSEDEYVSGLAANDKYLLLKYQRYEAYDDIFIAEKDGDRISRPEDMGEGINTGATESGATLSYSGDTLIFASDRDGGEGGLDLWMALKLPDGGWGKPINLGDKINTPYDEDYPHLMPDGKTMFFSSTGHSSMGGFDVFKTQRKDDGKWTEPRNFGYPVNNTYDNLTIAMSKNYRYAYVSDVREEGYGGMDIYRVVFNNTEANIFLHKGSLQDDSGNRISINKDVQPAIKVFHKEDDSLFGKYQYDTENQEFIMALPPGKYQLKIKVPGFKKAQKSIFVPDLLQNKTYNLAISLQPE